MTLNKKEGSKGFTIIEVVLVLAIAGLIFLVVFLALPALQRSQRDSQRKADLGKFMSQVVSYQSNNQGALPTAWDTTFKTGYLTNGNQKFEDPQSNAGTSYVITATATAPVASPTPAVGTITVYTGGNGFTCGGANGVTANTAANGRQIAAIIYQEQGKFSCQDN